MNINYHAQLLICNKENAFKLIIIINKQVFLCSMSIDDIIDYLVILYHLSISKNAHLKDLIISSILIKKHFSLQEKNLKDCLNSA